MVSLDLDIVVVASALENLVATAEKYFKVEKFTRRYNLSNPNYDLRIQIQIDPRYQKFIPRSSLKEVMRYTMKVASLKDVLQGKIWAYSYEKRRWSKCQKDLADIFRIVESYPQLKNKLPESIRNKLD